MVAVPSLPAPADIQIERYHASAMTESPFTYQQQVQDWGYGKWEGTVSLPPMNETDAAPWIAFLEALNGVVNVFVFPDDLVSAWPSLGLASGSPPVATYWRLKSSSWRRTLGVGSERFYGLSFQIVSAQ